MALDLLGHDADEPLMVRGATGHRRSAGGRTSDTAYCQPCVSPVWDTGLAALALLEDGAEEEPRRARAGRSSGCARSSCWTSPATGRTNHPGLPGGGWAFQYENAYYPDLDDTAVVAWAMNRAVDRDRYAEPIRRAADWLRGMQSTERWLCGLRFRQHPLRLERDPVRRPRGAARSADQRCERSLRGA